MNRREVLNLDTTLFALASGKLPSAVAIIRISGPQTFSILKKIFISDSFRCERGMHYGELRDPFLHEKIDDIVLLTFVSPHSFTGEDVAELQCHGSFPIVRKIENLLSQMGARAAEKGEFSYRALLNGKMSPEEVEDLSDVFGATTYHQIQNIYTRRRENTFLAQIENLKKRLIQIQAILDTAVDFSEEYSAVTTQSEKAIELAIHEVQTLLNRFEAASSRSFLPKLVLAGKPNAGKSSLFNLLLSRYRAVVNEEAGTTRDVIEEDIFIDGQDWKLVDTAGVRVPSGSIEEEGIQMGSEYLANSQFWVWVVDGTEGITEKDQKWYQKFSHLPHVILFNKKDAPAWKPMPSALSISCKTGEGLPELWAQIAKKSKEVLQAAAVSVPTRTEVARLSLVKGLLEELQGNVKKGLPPEYLSEESRKVIQSLEAVVGEISVDDVLERIFSEFCIGK